jgi:hypothetical protein
MNALEKYAAKRRLAFAMDKHAGVYKDMEKEAVWGLAAAAAGRAAAKGAGSIAARVARRSQGLRKLQHARMVQGQGMNAPGAEQFTNIGRHLREGVKKGVGAVKRFGKGVVDFSRRIVPGIRGNIKRSLKQRQDMLKNMNPGAGVSAKARGAARASINARRIRNTQGRKSVSTLEHMQPTKPARGAIFGRG